MTPGPRKDPARHGHIRADLRRRKAARSIDEAGSRKKVARALDVHRTRVSRYAHGDVSNPVHRGLEEFDRIFDALEDLDPETCDPEALLGVFLTEFYERVIARLPTHKLRDLWHEDLEREAELEGVANGVAQTFHLHRDLEHFADVHQDQGDVSYLLAAAARELYVRGIDPTEPLR